MSLHGRYLLGMISGVGSVAVKTGLNILVIPAFIAMRGLDAFGLYMLLVAVMEIATLLDLGAINALTTLLGGENADERERRAYLKVGQVGFGVLTLLMFLIGLALTPLFLQRFHIPPDLQHVAAIGFPLIMAESALMLYSGYYRAVLLAHCAHQWTNLADSLHATIANVGTLLALLAGCDIPVIIAIRLLGAGIRLLLMVQRTLRLEPFAFRPRMPFRSSNLKKLARLSSHAMMINFSVIISHKIDDIVIASFLPTSAIGIYEIVFRFLGVVIQICMKLHEGMYPLFARMASADRQAKARALFLRMSGFLHVTACLGLLLILFHYQELFRFFSAGRIPVEETLPVLWIAVPCIMTGVLQMPANAWLFTWRRQRYLTATSLMAAAANLALSLLLVRWMGLPGVALGTLIPQLIQHQAGLIRETCQSLRISAGQYLRTVHGAVILPVLVAGSWVWLCSWMIGDLLLPLLRIALISMSAAVIGASLWLGLTVSPPESRLLRRLWKVRLVRPAAIWMKPLTDNAS